MQFAEPVKLLGYIQDDNVDMFSME